MLPTNVISHGPHGWTRQRGQRFPKTLCVRFMELLCAHWAVTAVPRLRLIGEASASGKTIQSPVSEPFLWLKFVSASAADRVSLTPFASIPRMVTGR